MAPPWTGDSNMASLHSLPQGGGHVVMADRREVQVFQQSSSCGPGRSLPLMTQVTSSSLSSARGRGRWRGPYPLGGLLGMSERPLTLKALQGQHLTVENVTPFHSSILTATFKMRPKFLANLRWLQHIISIKHLGCKHPYERHTLQGRYTTPTFTFNLHLNASQEWRFSIFKSSNICIVNNSYWDNIMKH